MRVVVLGGSQQVFNLIKCFVLFFFYDVTPFYNKSLVTLWMSGQAGPAFPREHRCWMETVLLCFSPSHI